MCTWCLGNADTDCVTCLSSYYLIDDQAGCISQYTINDPADGTTYTNEHTCYSRRCATSCPTKYYFALS